MLLWFILGRNALAGRVAAVVTNITPAFYIASIPLDFFRSFSSYPPHALWLFCFCFLAIGISRLHCISSFYTQKFRPCTLPLPSPSPSSLSSLPSPKPRKMTLTFAPSPTAAGVRSRLPVANANLGWAFVRHRFTRRKEGSRLPVRKQAPSLSPSPPVPASRTLPIRPKLCKRSRRDEMNE